MNKKEIKEIMSKKLDYKKAKMFLHCKNCIDPFIDSNLHEVMTPRDYGNYEMSTHTFRYPNGDIANILVLWCKRCKKQVWDSRFLTHLF